MSLLYCGMFSISPASGVCLGGEQSDLGINLAPEVFRERFLSVEEAQRLIASIEIDVNKIARKAIMLLLLTGARRNEVTMKDGERGLGQTNAVSPSVQVWQTASNPSE